MQMKQNVKLLAFPLHFKYDFYVHFLNCKYFVMCVSQPGSPESCTVGPVHFLAQPGFMFHQLYRCLYAFIVYKLLFAFYVVTWLQLRLVY